MHRTLAWGSLRQRIVHSAAVKCSAGCRSLALGLLLAVVAPGCAKPKGNPTTGIEPPAVQVIHPQVRTIIREVGQPSFVEGFERTSIFPKVTGFIKKWNVDIGDKLKKGEVLCTLFVPELVEDFETKKATVQRDEERVELALELVEVASADVETAKACVTEAKAIVAKFQSDVERWESEVKRLTVEVKRGVVDPQVLSESQNQSRSNVAARNAAQASVQKAEADLLAKKASLSKTKIDVKVARADLAVAKSDAKRLEAWVGYLTITAPYDGVVVARNANTGDFVMPAAGDPTADRNAPHLSPSGNAAPIYVVERTDVVRIFVDVPEADANFVQKGAKASVLCRAYRDRPIPGTVTRTSWALNVKSRTLRAEVDLDNPGSRILPGMYAYGKIIIERPGVWALPESAIATSGDKTFYWRYEKEADGKERAVRTEVQTGITDGKWIEVADRQSPKTASGQEELWAPVDGSEQVLVDADLSPLADEHPVRRRPTADGEARAGE